jgi:NAD(P)H-hydrate epimerase
MTSMLSPSHHSLFTRCVLNRRWIREVDRRAIADFGMSGLVLMENAARGVVEFLIAAGCHSSVLIACGKGNNGGDGFAIARWLDAFHIPVRVLLVADPQQLTGDALANYRIVQQSQLPVSVVDSECSEDNIRQLCGESDWIVDALLGTGFSGETRPPLSLAIRVLNQLSARKIAVDLPSGLDCDSGLASVETFRAEHTLTFVAAKPGLLVPAAIPYCGEVHVVPIGVPRLLLEAIELESSLEKESACDPKTMRFEANTRLEPPQQ